MYTLNILKFYELCLKKAEENIVDWWLEMNV